MDVDATNAAFAPDRHATRARSSAGNLNWNAARTQLIYVPDNAVRRRSDLHGHLRRWRPRCRRQRRRHRRWPSRTKAAPVVRRMPARGTTSTTQQRRSSRRPGRRRRLAGYALNQVNAARAAYGFAPLVLDAAISAAASSHAWDQASNGYFSHYGLNGSTRESRLRAAGVSFGWSGENQCYHMGMSEQATLDWCHAQFMAEPYPGPLEPHRATSSTRAHAHGRRDRHGGRHAPSSPGTSRTDAGPARRRRAARRPSHPRSRRLAVPVGRVGGPRGAGATLADRCRASTPPPGTS